MAASLARSWAPSAGNLANMLFQRATYSTRVAWVGPRWEPLGMETLAVRKGLDERNSRKNGRKCGRCAGFHDLVPINLVADKSRAVSTQYQYQKALPQIKCWV
jgi:hypothetical protein